MGPEWEMWPTSEDTVPRRLDLVVSSVAAQLMDATASTAAEMSQQVLANLVEQFDADPVFAYCAQGKEPIVIGFDPTKECRAYQGQIAASRRVGSPSVAVAPLVSRGVTTGLLGFINFGGRTWPPELMNTLAAIAPMFAGFQVRIATEEKLRYLADHDDLTGLHNRRSLIAHLTDRLAAGRPGPVAVLYLDLDRLKSINDYFGHTVGDQYLRVFAERLLASLGGLAVIGRHGGDEFLVIADGAMPTGSAESL